MGYGVGEALERLARASAVICCYWRMKFWGRHAGKKVFG